MADDLSSGNLENLTAVISEIEFLQGDLKNIDFTHKATNNCDVVFHLAADHGGRGYIATHPANCAGNMALDNIVFESAVKNDVEKMVDFNRCGGAFADEEYGWAKLMGEMSLCAYHKQYGIKAASARLSTAYGPRENESHALVALISKAFIKQSPFRIWGTGGQTRGFTYMRDIINGLLLIAEHVEDASAINLGTSEYISLNTVAEEIFNVFGWRPEDGIKHQINKPVGVIHRALDGSLAKKRCGWSPQTTIEEGIEKTVKWYIENHDPDKVKSQLPSLLMKR